MKINIDKFTVASAKKKSTSSIGRRVKPFYDSEEDYDEFLHRPRPQIERDAGPALRAQSLRRAPDHFQAMDAAGKDSAIKHVLSGVNPQGCQVSSFKQPSARNLAHDFLWRTTCRLPERGHIGIFNRSYYEEVLIARVHPEILRGQLLPEEAIRQEFLEAPFSIHRRTLKSISTATAPASSNFSCTFPRRSKSGDFPADRRAGERIGNSARLTFASANSGKQYMKAYEECLRPPAPRRRPGTSCPSDDKPNARLIVSEIIVAIAQEFKDGFFETNPGSSARSAQDSQTAGFKMTNLLTANTCSVEIIDETPSFV
jgi:polyphosphate kinase 2 (PPK2 family)